MNANPYLLQMKYARVVDLFSKKAGITLDEALCFFYHSTLYRLIREGVSDLHCMSDEYLADEFMLEYKGERVTEGVAEEIVKYGED